MGGIYDYVPETNHVSKLYIVLQMFRAYNLRHIIVIIIIIIIIIINFT